MARGNVPFYKQPAEKYLIAMDYTSELSTGETIASATVKCYEVVAGTDVTTTLIDSSSTTTTQAKTVIKAGTSGKKYKVIFLTTTSLGYIFEDDVFFFVQSI
jgi:hypothetical protein